MRRFAGLVAIGMGFAASTAIAQIAQPATPNSATQLQLPDEFMVFGERDPNVRKPTAIINGDIITRTDVDYRVALVLASNPGTQISDEQMQQLRLEVVRNLIDEMLQVQEAAANEISITEAELNQAYSEFVGRQSLSPEQFATYLSEQGSSESTLQRQITAELAWTRLLRRRVNPFVNVSDAEVQDIVDRLESSRGQTEYRVSEIFLPATPADEAQVLAQAEDLIAQMRAGAPFGAIARVYSRASTAAVGGDLGWIRPEQLPAPLDQAVQQVPRGSLSAPIPIPGGFSIIAISDQRQVLTADPRDALLSLKQVSIIFAPGTPREVAEPRVAALAEATQAGGGCGVANDIASSINAEVVENDGVRLRDLPEALQEAMLNMQIGESTPPFGSLDQGVRVLILCGRDAPTQAAEPDAEVIMARMENERVNRRAERYLRDLRRDAVIEYR